jgi:hypothetical protein
VIVESEELGVLDPLVDDEALIAQSAALLDEAKTHLEAAGETFMFPLSSGFAGFDTPATFLTFNRALKARVDVYRASCDDALTALSESFLVVDAAAPQLGLGVYNVYGSGPGDTLNGLTSPNLFAHPSVLANAEAGDLRVAAKLVMVESRTVQGLTSDQGFTMYQDITAPVPIIRNEELILLRAEANICVGGSANIAAAIDDLNFIRVNSGGLAARTDLDMTNIVDELLQQRFYSLLFEGGHRWIDMRRFNMLDQLPIDLPEHNVHEAFPIPLAETDARM